MNKACSVHVYKLLPVRYAYLLFVEEILSHFALLQLYSNHLVLSLPNIEVKSDDGSHLKALDFLGPGRQIFNKMCTRSFIVKR